MALAAMTGLLAGLTASASLSAQDTGRLLGQVVDQDSGAPVEAAEVVLDDTRTAETDDEGRFLFAELQEGTHTLRISALGYEGRTVSVETVGARTVEARIPVTADPVELDPIEVSVRSRWLEANGFYRRMEAKRGYRLTRPEIVEESKQRFTDLVRDVPGVRIRSSGLGDGIIVSGRYPGSFGSGDLRFSVYIDGAPVDPMAYNSLHPDEIEAIEVFQGTEVPIQYSGKAVMLVWTRGN